MPKIVLQAQDLSFAYPQQLIPLFASLNFCINTQDRIGLIGENGTGKSTLLQILQGHILPQQGQLHHHPGLRLGYWAQTPPATAQRVSEFLWQARPELAHLQQQLEQAETLTPEALVEVLSRFEVLGGYTFEDQAQRQWSQVGGDIQHWDRPLLSLSGGEQARVLWCHLQLQNANLYLIDEPGNHLDSKGMAQLELFLQQSPYPYLLISHDRALLENCCTQIWQLEQGGLTQRQGNLSGFQAEQQATQQRLARQSAQHDKALQRLQQAAQKQRQQAERFEHFKPQRSIKKNGGICKRDEGGGKASLNVGGLMRKAKATEARMERLAESIQRPHTIRQQSLHFQQGTNRHQQLVYLEQLSLGYHQRFCEPLNWQIQAGEKWQLQGVNGSGKSTLLQALWHTAREQAAPCELRGLIHWAKGIQVAYLPQHAETSTESQTAIPWVIAQADPQRPEAEKRTAAQTLLACLNIQGTLLQQPIMALSPGERQRVILAGLLIQNPDLLLLDEPTNHLARSARESLAQALQQYPGALVLVSHDRYFSAQLVNPEHVLSLRTHAESR